MRPETDYLLDEIVSLPECEPIPPDDQAAIAYMSQWDTGEYPPDRTALSELYGFTGRICTHDGYVLFRAPDGSAALYRRGAVCHSYELRQIDAWADGDGGWTWNESWPLKTVHVAEGREEEYLLALVAADDKRHHVEHDGNGLYEVQEANSGRPLFAILPVED